MTFIEFFKALFSNRILLSAGAGWFFAQLIKMLLCGFLQGEWRLERMVGSGGMPSSHAATVCALVVATCANYGPASFEFAIAALLAVVVLHDARGVRWETGKQAMAINNLYAFLEEVTHSDLPEPEKLKVLVGHSPLQVIVGSAIGILTGLLIH